MNPLSDLMRPAYESNSLLSSCSLNFLDISLKFIPLEIFDDPALKTKSFYCNFLCFPGLTSCLFFDKRLPRIGEGPLSIV